jgi:hypothetical protein
MTARRWATLLALTLVTGASACGDPSGALADDREPLEFRVRNASAYAFDSVVVGFPAQREAYPALAPGRASSYRTVSRAYRYAYVEVYAQGTKLVQQPIDYVGESLLSPGRYAYVIEVASLQNPFGVSTRLEKE